MDSIKDDVRLKIDNKIVQKGVEITSKPIRGMHDADRHNPFTRLGY
jgi:hypothetical protein